jgi:hypothetical protein
VAVTAHVYANPLTGALVITGQAPSVLTTDNVAVQAQSAFLYLAGQRPTILGGFGAAATDGLMIGSNMAVGEFLEVGGDLVIWENLKSQMEIPA